MFIILTWLIQIFAYYLFVHMHAVAIVGFGRSSYEAFELNRIVEICLTKSVDTAFPITLTVVPVETVDLPDNVIAAAVGTYVQENNVLMKLISLPYSGKIFSLG